MTDHGETCEPQAAAPPTFAAPLAAKEPQAGWPGVIGIIAIVFGSLGALLGAWSFASLVFLPWLMELAGTGFGLPPPEHMRTQAIFGGVTAVPLGLLLLFAGIATLRRRRRCVRLGVIWAMLKIPVVVAGAAVAVGMQRAQFDSIAAQAPGMAVPFTGTVIVFTVVLQIILGWSLPVFLLIWFSRRRIKDETAVWS